MLCVIDHKSPCMQDCPYHYREGGCFWEDVHRAAKPYYRTCPKCGAHLDPGEVCDCTKKSVPSVAAPRTLINKKNNHLDCTTDRRKFQWQKLTMMF